ncbi:MAG: tRNA (guanosine(37)-N1)-methyltransferase TrmD [Candidatus Coatesbacteria bacterium]|nr:tRNA (guanosine(37)-N1)-methyltransferase TrmD [Candidatus Coatesbacteria bacterium]
MIIDVLTIFPKLFEPFFSLGIVNQSIKKGKVKLAAHDLRDFTEGNHKQVDDYPYGGGDGMIMKPEPIVSAVENLRLENTRLMITSPVGRILDQDYAIELSLEEHLLIICGRYRGIDNRVMEILNPEFFSLGKFVLSGGEIAAITLIETVIRLIPGVIENSSSIFEDAYISEMTDYPHYTRPRVFRGFEVPQILLNGNFQEIEKWRREKRKEIK